MFRTLILSALLGVGLVGCSQPVRIAGGGSLPSGEGQAHFGFSVNTCGDHIRGQMTYVDMIRNVAVHGVVNDALECVGDACNACSAGDVQVNMDVRSLDKTHPGWGTAVACVSGADHMAVTFLTGPFKGYSNSGDVKGNLNFHDCQ